MPSFSQILILGWMPGYLELAIFAGILLLLFGSQKLPMLMRNMGRSVNEFKAGIKEKPVVTPHVEDESADDESDDKVQTS